MALSTPLAAQLGSRALFADLQAPIYANFAGISPPSRPVRDAAMAQIDDVAARGSGSFGTWIAQRQALKADLAGLLGCESKDLGLIHNTTLGVTAIAFGISLRQGERILCVDREFPANIVPWQQAAARFGADVSYLPAPEGFPDLGGWLDRVQAALQAGARVLAISAVRFQTGWRAPLAELAELCHRYGAELAVDAVQAVGVVPLDVTALGIDYLACGAHKWLMGPEGAGLFYVHPSRLQRLHKTLAGWLSVPDPADFLIHGPGLLRHDKPVRDRADFVEGANISAMSCAGLAASVTILQQLGVPTIYAHVQAWQDALEPLLVGLGLHSLRPLDPARRSGILALQVPTGVDVVGVHRRLAELGVICSIPDGNLRFSAHWPSALDEPPRIAAAVAQTLADLTSMS